MRVDPALADFVGSFQRRPHEAFAPSHDRVLRRRDQFPALARHANAEAKRSERIKQKVSGKQYQIYYLNVVKRMSAQTVAQTLEVNAAQVYLARHRVGALLKKEIQALQARAR